MTDEEMKALAVEISKKKVKDTVPTDCPRTVSNPGLYYGALMALKHLDQLVKDNLGPDEVVLDTTL